MILALPLAALAALAPLRPAAPDPRHPLMPVPASLVWGDGRLRVDTAFAVAMPARLRDARLARAVARFLMRLGHATGLRLAQGQAGLTLAVKGPGEPVQSPAEDESYALALGAARAPPAPPVPRGGRAGRARGGGGRGGPGPAPRRRRELRARRGAVRRHARRRDDGGRAPRPGDPAPASPGRLRRLVFSRGTHRGPAPLRLARAPDRRRTPLRAAPGHQAAARRDGRGQAQRLPLASLGRPGLPGGEPALSAAAGQGLRQPLLQPAGHQGDRGLRARPRDPRAP